MRFKQWRHYAKQYIDHRMRVNGFHPKRVHLARTGTLYLAYHSADCPAVCVRLADHRTHAHNVKESDRFLSIRFAARRRVTEVDAFLRKHRNRHRLTLHQKPPRPS